MKLKKLTRQHNCLGVLAALALTVVPVDFASADRSASEIEALVQAMLAKMSLEEKVGQMTQVTLAVVGDDDANDGKTLDPGKLKEAIHKYHVGSILNTIDRSLTSGEWHEVLHVIQDEALRAANPIPVLYGIDSIHGANYVAGATIFPHNIGLGAARSRALVADVAKVTAKETRAAGIRWNFDPDVDVGRNPLWSRFEETFGEDAYLVGELGSAAVKAYEQDGLDRPTAVASCIKHFLGYSDPGNGKDRTPAYIPDIELWEHHVPPFAAGVEAGAATIMINSASVNGTPVHASKRLLTDLLRTELGFKGVVVSDWRDIIRLHTRHRVAESPREAVKLGVEAGIDMSMVPFDFSFAELLTDLVKSGDVSEERIDQSVRRILRLKYELGLFDNAYPEPEAAKNFADSSYAELALDAARQTMTLLKNAENVLPLKDGTRLLLTGPAARNLGALHSSWSYVWQGDDELAYPDSTMTIADAVTERFGDDNVVVMADPEFSASANYDGARLQQLAAGVDAIVLALGEPPYAESPGAIDDLSLPEKQIQLAEAALGTGKLVILVLVEGRPRVLGPIVAGMAAVVQAYRPGSRGAEAIADVLSGDHNPSGVLPYTYPKYSGDLMTYDRRASADVQQLTPGNITYGGYKPEWPFGHGLSYTTFELEDLKLDRSSMHPGGKLEVSVTVRNAGRRDGEKVVDLYISDLYASLAPAERKLRRFDKVFVKAGKKEFVRFVIGEEDLAFVNADLKRVVEPGAFKVIVGDQEADFRYVK